MDKQTNILSIITINYNNFVGLQKTMQSVFQQSFADFEYIVIDGNSTDDSVKTIKSFVDFNFKWVSETDSGIYNAMNKGIDLSSGKYILFLNSGDYLENNLVLEKIMPSLTSDISFIGANLFLETNNGRIEKKHPNKISFSYLLTKSLYHPSTFINKKMFDKYGLYNEKNKIVSDWEFFFKAIALNGEHFLNIDIGFTVFDMQGISSRPESNELVQKEREQVLKKYLKSVFNNDFDIFMLSQLKAPSKRIKYLQKIEKSVFLRKATTVMLSFISIFIKKQ